MRARHVIAAAALWAMAGSPAAGAAVQKDRAELDALGDVITRLVTEMIACSPASWDRGVLTIQSDGVRLTYQLRNVGHAERASISDELRTLIDELYVTMADRGQDWRSARVEFTRNGGRVHLDTRFDYDDAASPAPAAKRRE
jgi:hypothetical protein